MMSPGTVCLAQEAGCSFSPPKVPQTWTFWTLWPGGLEASSGVSSPVSLFPSLPRVQLPFADQRNQPWAICCCFTQSKLSKSPGTTLLPTLITLTHPCLEPRPLPALTHWHVACLAPQCGRIWADPGNSWGPRSSQASVSSLGLFLTCQSMRLQWAYPLTLWGIPGRKGQWRLFCKRETFGKKNIFQTKEAKQPRRRTSSTPNGVSHFHPEDLQERKLQGIPWT